MKSFTVQDLPVEERPRERLVKYGAEHISAQELLAVVLGRGTAGISVMTLSQNLLKEFGSLEAIVSSPLEALQNIKGLGPAKALQLKACLEIARRVIHEETTKEHTRNTSKSIIRREDIGRAIRPLIRNWQKEHFFVISFDTRNRILATDLIGVGTLNANLVHPREIFEIAIQKHAACIAVSHNHPSGDPTPSETDIAVTNQIKEAGKLMGITLLDHVIISKTHLYSFQENGVL